MSQQGFLVPAPCLPRRDAPSVANSTIQSPGALELDFLVATANVNSMYTSGDGFSGKLAYLTSQFDDQQLLLVGVQEARTPRGFFKSGDYLRLCSGAQQGTLGTELWISTKLPYGSRDGHPYRLRKEHFALVFAEPRRLLCRLEAPGLQLWIFVGHAPHTGKTQEEIAEWWDHTSALLLRHDVRGPLLALVDANATMGLPDGIAVRQGGSTPSASTELFRDFLSTWELCIASSLGNHAGTINTWTSPNGTYSRDLDHIAISSSLSGACTWSQVLQDVDITGGHVDHHAIAARLTWTTSTTCAPNNIPQTTWDRDKIAKNPQLLYSLKTLASSPWSTDIESEIKYFNDQVHQRLRTYCAKRREQPKKPYISEEAWQLRSSCSRLHSQLRQLSDESQRDLMRGLFQHWSAQRFVLPRFSEENPVASQYRMTLHCIRLRLGVTLATERRKLKQLLRRDKHSSLQATLASFRDDTPASEILRTLRPYIGPSNAKRFFQQPLPIVRNVHGDLCSNPAEAQEAWTDFFAAMEGGTKMTKDSIRTSWRHHLAAFLTHAEVTLLEEIPSLCDLETASRRVACGKAAGPDLLPPEVFHHHPQAVGRLLYPALLKLLLHGQEDLRHKQGRLAVAWKRKGPPDQCSSYRSLLISSHCGKTIHRALRQKQTALYESFLQEQQVGGRQSMPVTFAGHQVKAYCRWLTHRGRPGSVFYLDLTEAFYRVLRPLVTDQIITDYEVASFVHKMNLPPEVFHDLCAHIRAPKALELAGAPASVRRVAHALHTDTHFWVQNDDCPVRTTRGTRPGDSWADVIFGYLWARILRRYEQQLIAEHLIEHLPWTPAPGLWALPSTEQRHYVGPCWMDDLAVMTSADTCPAAIAKALRSASILLDLCLAHGLCPNLSAGKTEIMFLLRGPGKKTAQQQLYGPLAPPHVLAVGEYQTYQIHVTGSYVHLGSQIHHNGKGGKELRRRIAMGHQSLSSHARLLFTNRALPLRQRTALFQTMIEPKITYGMESWCLTPAQVSSTWNAAFVRLYRRLLRVRPEDRLTTAEILYRVELPSGELILRRNRLRYLAVLYQNGNSALWQLLCVDHEWLQLCHEDLTWMWTQLARSSDLPDPNLDHAPWEHILKHQPKRWKGLVKRAVAHAIQQQCSRHVVDQSHAFIAGVLGATIDGPLQSHPPGDFWACFECKHTFKSKAGLHAHLCRKHGQLSTVRYLFDGTQCPSCLKEYHVTAKLHQHLYYSHRCRLDLQHRRHFCEPQPGRGSRENDAQVQQHGGLAPVSQGAGPLLPAAAAAADLTYHIELEQALVTFLLDLPTDITVEHLTFGLASCIEAYPAGTTEVFNTIQRVIDGYGDGEALHTGVPVAVVHAGLHRLMNADYWLDRWRGQDHPAPLPSQRFAADNCADWQLAPPQVRPLAGTFTERVVLHLFSGRRRTGDLQLYLERLHASRPHCVLTVVSVDIVCSTEWGDISQCTVRKFWLDAIQQGLVAAVLVGPPCETWSQARAQVEDDARGPRPVRSAAALWGFSAMRLREIRQVRLGNTLLSFALEAMTCLYMVGGCGVLEHPACPLEDEAPSIWRLPIIQHLLQLPGFRLHEVHQGRHGAPSAKPTGLLTLNISNLEEHLAAWTITQAPYPEVSIGRGQDGHYRTARLKEYPPAFCAGLSTALTDAMDRCVIEPDREFSMSFLDRCKAMQCGFTHFMGRDYQGS
eukprot:Skav214502  [mRNA]  locus=scaffold1011:346373:351469:+ [translate_table: standard]